VSTTEKSPASADQTTGDDLSEAVEAQMGKLLTELGSSVGVLLTSVGTRSGLWSALHRAGPLTSTEVAARVTVDPALVREWLRAQAAGGYLDYDGERDTFTLSEPVAAALVDGPGGALVEACVSMFCSMAETFDDFTEAFGAGQGYGWHQRTPRHWAGTDAFTRVALPDELVGSAIDLMPGVATALRAGGNVADVGCGYGAPTLGVAELFPSAHVLGVDDHDASIVAARAAAAERGVTNVRFEVASANDLPEAPRGYDLITFFDSLHDMGDPRAALARARATLAPGGAVLLFEPFGADRVQDNLNPNGRMFYAISTLACTPNAVSQRTATSSEPLGAQAGEGVLRALAVETGFAEARRLEAPAPFNLVLELRP
jgi:2-polyprenyl-3-methyl-5-hydroxy-6-metoxy-1,4-benzoquinol methylase